MSPAEFDVARAVEEALEADEWRRGELVGLLQRQGGRAALQAADRLRHDPSRAGRELAADILGQLGAGPDVPPARNPFRAEATALLLAMIEHEDHPTVLRALAVGLGHMAGEDGVAPLVRLRAHPDADVRGGVVSGLLGRETRAALDALIELSADTDADVRDWATFGLARQSDADFPELREALVARLDDDDPDALAEAVHGLAMRGDERALPQLLRYLADPDQHSDLHMVDQATCALGAATGDPRLLPHLEAMLVEYAAEPDKDELLRALERYGR